MRCSTPILSLLLFAGIGLATAAAEELDCASCHEEVVNASAVHEGFDCTACHSNIETYPHPEDAIGERRGAAICAVCHDAQVTGAHSTLACVDCHQPAHAIGRPSEAICNNCHNESAALSDSVHSGQVLCRDCHAEAHDILPSTDRESRTSPIRQFETCGRCHADPTDPVGRYLTSSHGRALLLKGLIGAPACSNCHGSHDVLPATDPRSTLSRERSPQTCGKCHEFILDDWVASGAHGASWAAGSRNGPVCTTCHPSHQAQPISEPSARLKTPQKCAGCHDEQYLTYRDSFHGKATSLGFVTAALCSDCHTAHKNLPASDPRSTINEHHLVETCARCHANATASFVSFDPHAVPTDKARNPELYYVWLFMTSLLVAVFGFFGLHDLLWLQRVVVAVRRGELGSRPVSTGPHIRRFSTVEIYMHGVVILTFLVLAATGLPLKFNSARWAPVLTAAFGGIENMRIFHRLAAVLTFGYAFAHLGTLFYRGVVEREPGLLWGWKSLVPRPSDLVNLWQNLRYFLYLGPRPHFDRWTYWEKFDYFAVFWGVIIIGASGLLLWFPAFFTHWLPGWVLNAAFVIHSDEALLAVGFIFLFHFFHTHLRPESMPLDPVIFTGLMPLERFREERPLEYQRLVDAGELQSRLVPPPPASSLRSARVIGFFAVSIGLFLVAAILSTFLLH